MKTLPKFKDEAEEAEWWFVHRDEIAEDMIQASHNGTLGEGTAVRRARKLKQFEAKQSSQSAA